jgi:uncharacterized membrane protein YdjX (TVP38/TMEM64 family)
VLGAIALVLIGVAAGVWRYTPLADIATPDRLAHWIGTFKDARWAPAAVLAMFVVGGILALPLVLMIAATAIVFEPLTALLLSLAGALLSAASVYVIGARFGRGLAHRALGSAVKRVGSALERSGILAVAAIRTVPIAPFTVVNLAAGSIGVRFSDYMIGTALGLMPGLVVITAFGNQLRAVFEDPTPGKLGTIIGIIVAWIALSLVLQRFVSRRQGARRA